MGLERFDPEDHNPLQWDGQMVARADGEYYRAAEVNDLLARIRAAVAAEREAPRGVESCDDPDCGCWDSYNEARAALDALLADGGA